MRSTGAPPGGGALVIALFVTGQVLLLGFLAWKYADGEAVEPVATVTRGGSTERIVVLIGRRGRLQAGAPGSHSLRHGGARGRGLLGGRCRLSGVVARPGER